MPATIEWDPVVPDVMLMTLVSPWTWEEYYQVDDKFGEMLADPAPERVDVIVDFTNGTVLPTNIFTHFQRSSQNTHPSINLIMAVGVNNVLRRILGVIVRLFPHLDQRIRFCQTVEEARTLIQRDRNENA
jgi:hypothetical protein